MIRSGLKKLLIVLFWLVLWQVLSVLIDNSILLAGPVESARALFKLAATSAFWLSVLLSVLKITLGFVMGLALGIALASLSYRFSFFKSFISPVVSVIKSIPVASFVIIVLIWAGSGGLSTVISALVVFPMIYLNVLAGLESTDKKLIELADMFSFGKISRILYVYLPSIAPHLVSAVSISSGMAFKSGIAAEVIGRPLSSIGNGLYLSKISLATDNLFAWTFCAVILSYLFEKGISLLIRRIIKA